MDSALRNIRIIEDMDFSNLKISVKSSMSFYLLLHTDYYQKKQIIPFI